MKRYAATVYDALELNQGKGWGATLEDAIVIQTALVLDVPVWTLNYRDFAAVKTLRFWTP
jgi:predicted nucleic acid-binding protein